MNNRILVGAGETCAHSSLDSMQENHNCISSFGSTAVKKSKYAQYNEIRRNNRARNGGNQRKPALERVALAAASSVGSTACTAIFSFVHVRPSRCPLCVPFVPLYVCMNGNEQSSSKAKMCCCEMVIIVLYYYYANSHCAEEKCGSCLCSTSVRPSIDCSVVIALLLRPSSQEPPSTAIEIAAFTKGCDILHGHLPLSTTSPPLPSTRGAHVHPDNSKQWRK